MYLTVLDGSMGYMMGKHDETGRKEHDIYYMSKNFRLWIQILVTGENFMCTHMGRSMPKAVHVNPHYMVDIKDGSHQV